MTSRRRRWVRRSALGVVALLVVVGVASQIVLPRVAEGRVRDELARYGDVRSVDVDAFPALKLLAGHADRVQVEMSSAQIKEVEGGSNLLDNLDAVDELDVTVANLVIGPLLIRDTALSKDGAAVDATGRLPDDDLVGDLLQRLVGVESAPSGFDIVPVRGGDRGRVRVYVDEGELRAAPVISGIPIVLAERTLLAEPGLRVTTLRAREVADGVVLDATGQVR